MPNRKSRFITCTPSLAFAAFFNQIAGVGGGPRAFGELFYADPLLQLIRTYYRTLRVNNVEIRRVDKPLDHLLVDGRNPYIYGLSLLQKLVKRRRMKRRRDVFPSWNARRSLSVSGDFSGIAQIPLVGFLNSWTSPAISSIPIALTRVASTSGTQSHFSFDDVKVLARKLQPYVGSFFRRDGGTGVGEHTLNSMFISDDLVKYKLVSCQFDGPGSGYWQNAPALWIVIRRLDSGDMSIDIHGLGSAYVDKNPNLKPKYRSHALAEATILSDGSPVLSHQMHHSVNYLFGDLKMRRFRPALYHTQGGALAQVLIDYGKNFENFIELPQLLDLFELVYKTRKLGQWVSRLSWQGKLEWLSRVFCGSWLSKDFTLRPTLQAIKDLATAHSRPFKGEKSMIFDTTDISTLPEGLKLLLSDRLDHFFNAADITHFRADFRTEVTISPDEVVLARAVMEHDPLAFLGLYPTPSGAWNTGKFTFIVDWFVPIGRLIKDHESYVRSPSLDCRIGHTALFKISTTKGLTYTLFWRSSYNDRPTDPPGDSWLQALGLPSISIPLAVSMLLSGRRYD